MSKVEILREILGSGHRVGQEFLFFCPQSDCNHHKPKMSVNIDKDSYKCWICNYSGRSIRRLVRKHGTFLQRQKWDDLTGETDLSGATSDLYELMFGEEPPEVEPVIELPTEFISLANNDLPRSANSAKKYLRSRGITKEDILKWKIGFCPSGDYKSRVIIPSFNEDGKVNYFVARSYDKSVWPPYKNPEVGKDIIFNELYVDFDEDVTITEGALDAVKAWNAIPILGSTLPENSKLFQALANYDSTVFVALDPDAEKKAMKLIQDLISYDMEVYKIDVTGYQDIGTMTKEVFLERKAGAELMTAASLLKYRMRNIA